MSFSKLLHTVGQWFLHRSRMTKRLITTAVDIVAVVFALWVAFSLRFGELYVIPQQQLWIFLVAPLLAIPVFIKFGLYRAVIRYIGMDAVWGTRHLGWCSGALR